LVILYGNLIEHQKVGNYLPEAEAYANWADYELPTEALWEYFAKDGDERHYPWADDFWYTSTQPTYNLSGNVAEWVKDWYNIYPSIEETDPEGPVSGTEKVVRGGSFISGRDDLTTTRRMHYPPEFRTNWLGMRVAKNDVVPEPCYLLFIICQLLFIIWWRK